MTTEEIDKELLRCYVKYYTPIWFLKRLLQFRLWRFLPYALHVGWKNKHYVIPAWNKLWSGRKNALEQKIIEDNVISEFNQINKSRDMLTKIS
jgi:hypothetical protein